MKIAKFLISLIFTIILVFFLGRPLTIGGEKPTKLPPLGDFFSPFTGFWQNAESSRNYTSHKIEIPAIKGSVRVLFDERMVPHIFAENLEDAVFAQGYVEAKHRLWQMDLLSRVCSGRLAEVMGSDLLETDKLQRRRGMVYGAKNALKSWQTEPVTYRLLEAYSNGVNAYIGQLPAKDRPIEFKLLNYHPEEWSVLKTAFVKKYMDLTLCFGEDDLEATNALQVFGEDDFNKLYPEYNPRQQPVIPAGTAWSFTPVELSDRQDEASSIGLIHHEVYPKERELVGSNNWAVSGSKTASGNPILCNDPHLRLALPSIWYELQIHTPESNVYGVSIPGIPGITIGFNENVAWGVTNVGQDVLDWYQIDWTDREKTSYQIDGKVKKINQVVESFAVKGQDELAYDTVKWTEWGPVVYESDDNSWQDLAMHWLGHQAPAPRDLNTFIGLNQANGLADYEAAIHPYSFPAQNFAFADRHGDIAITVNGMFPLKKRKQGRFVQDGGNSQNAWFGFIPKEHVPKIVNPDRGFVASANQHSTDPAYPYYYNSSQFDDYRGRHLVEQLNAMDSITIADMMALQNSNYSLLAEEGLHALLKNISEDSLSDKQLSILHKMKDWNHYFDGEKVEPVIFEVWWENCYEMTFDEVTVYRDSIPMLMPESWRLVELLSGNPDDPFFDELKTQPMESASNVVTASFIKTCDELADNLVDPGFNWSSYKSTAIMHMARIPAFSKMNLDLGGNRQALNAISETHGPSWRMIVELGEEVRGWGVLPGGQSGNPGSPYYLTGLEKWSQGKYNELFYMKDEKDDRMKTLFSLQIN